jgi:hypothetical protein
VSWSIQIVEMSVVDQNMAVRIGFLGSPPSASTVRIRQLDQRIAEQKHIADA